MSLENRENRRTINDNQDLNEVPVLPSAPKSPEELADYITPEDPVGEQVRNIYEERNIADREIHKKEKLSIGKKLALGAMATVGVAGTAVVAVMMTSGPRAEGQNNNLPPAPEPTAEAPVVPGEVIEPTVESTTPVEVSPTDIPTNIADPTPIETEQGSEYSVAELREMELSDFKTLTVSERKLLITDMLEYSSEMNSFKFGENFMGEDTSDLYNFNPLDIASKDNTAEEIAMQDLYMHQLALTQTKDMNTSGSFNPDMAAKALSGAYIDIDFTDSGKESFTDGNNLLFEDWQRTFNNLDNVTTHEFPQSIESAEITNSTTIPDDNGKMLDIVTVEYVTEELPETLGEYPAGRKMAATKNFVWNDDANMWLSYKGGFLILPEGN